ncbi:hypothetical protein QUH71_02280 [Priestia aryabhattai]|uniref:hypothetical protein n=1 Tax=Priestia aryabhattai TaxID=412384 RepID=UPI0025A3E695|nr:hypothetical protein [Priestia aryabhattai]WJN45331.1 hypothetical protein QUH71_02280 [Priestia aryabhattai]
MNLIDFLGLLNNTIDLVKNFSELAHHINTDKMPNILFLFGLNANILSKDKEKGTKEKELS